MAQSKSHGQQGSGSHAPMTPSAAARIQSTAAKAGGGQVAKGSFAARAQSAAARNSSKGGHGKR